ncbi:flagellar hook-basal body protein [Novosphingobium sp.]|uniref:flagellar hook-basal body protein n=1 Tax=Novosphingobium sp. TaxID=1874826 RepID=UPI0035AE42A1
MSGALEIAMVGMRTQQQALLAVAGNISNINTPAYKRVDLRFVELVGVSPNSGANGAANTGTDVVAGVASWTAPTFDAQGQVEATGNPQDIAINGSGFIELLGPNGRSLLWRGGTMRIMEDGALATSSGQLFKAGINVPQDASALRIDSEGKVFVTQAGVVGETQIGEIGLIKVINPDAIERLDGGLYAVRDEAAVLAAAPGEDGLGTLSQGSIERSNVDLNSEMVALLIAQRAYAANAQVARAADEFFGVANGLRR